jgi:serine/alanine adding enzyme
MASSSTGQYPESASSARDAAVKVAARDRLKAEMGRISRQIGDARRRGEDVQELLKHMRRLSQERREIDAADASAATEVAPQDASADARHASDDALNDQRARPAPLKVTARRYPNPSQSAHELVIDVCAPDGAWDAFVTAHPRGTPYHLGCWRSIIESVFGHETNYVAARDRAGRIHGVLPLVRQHSRLFGDHLVSLPFVNYGGALGDSADVEVALMRHAAALGQEAGVSHVEFRDTVSRADWPVRTDKYSLQLALPAAAEQLWSGFSSKLRAQIRRGEREQPETRIGGHELIVDFYEVFARNMRDLGTPVYARQFFDAVLEHASGHVRVVVVYLAGRPVASALLVGHCGMLEIPWASSLREFNSKCLNMVLYWRVLQHAIESGHTTFDFGRSTRDAGTYRFKRQWGAQPVPLYWHYWLSRGSELPRLSPDNPKYRLAIAAWKRMPLWLANAVGPRIVRNLP